MSCLFTFWSFKNRIGDLLLSDLQVLFMYEGNKSFVISVANLSLLILLIVGFSGQKSCVFA